jgi:hypothetical protein
MHKTKLYPMTLDLFEGGSAGAGAGEGGASEGSGENNSVPVAVGRKGSELANVRYGLQAEDVQPQTEEAEATTEEGNPPSEADRRKAYQELIRGEYKDIHTDEVQKIINKRFKETKTLEESNAAQKEVLELLASRYGVDGNNLELLKNAIENDDASWEAAALNANMDVDQYKRWTQLERQNKALLEQSEQRARLEQSQRQTAAWMAEAEALKATYPDFDLEAEVTDQRFQAMLKSGVPMEQCYKVMHFDELQEASKKATEQALVQNIRAKGSRPIEQSSGGTASFEVRNDVSKFTKADRAEIARRVSRGDSVYL